MTKRNLYKPILVNLEPALVQELDAVAAKLGSTRAWLIRRALAEFLAMLPPPTEAEAAADATEGAAND